MQKPDRNDTEILQHKRVTQADGNVTEKFDTSLMVTLFESLCNTNSVDITSEGTVPQKARLCWLCNEAFIMN